MHGLPLTSRAMRQLFPIVSEQFSSIIFFLAFFSSSPSSDLEGGAQDAYARAGEAVSETLALIRTVTAFGGQRAEVAR